MILDPADILPNIQLFIITIARLLHLVSVCVYSRLDQHVAYTPLNLSPIPPETHGGTSN
jgi:hypothetical protein